MSKDIVNKHTVNLKIIHTSDVHGCFFMRDHLTCHSVKGGMARVYGYLQNLRKTYGKNLLLMDGGDILQGSPIVYYSNFISPANKDLAAEVMNYMGYDVATIGNHDIEMGHEVYDRWISKCNFPIVSANIIDKKLRKNYFTPYSIIERDGVKIAVLGMTTPAVPNWLPPKLWDGMEFENMVDCAQRWIPVIQKKESPDLVIGLFHSGKEGGIVTPDYVENAALDVARSVPGFDIICYGHDHMKNCEFVEGPNGKNVLCCAPSSMAAVIDEIDIEVEIGGNEKRLVKICGRNVDLSYYKEIESQYMQRYFNRYIRNTDYYVGQKIGVFKHTIKSQDAYFGSSAFVDLIHRVQLEVTKAQISFASPVSFVAKIKEGDVCVRDVFSLYRYDDVLYTLRLKGSEVRMALEMSYNLWVNQMKSPEDHIMLLDYVLNDGKRLGFKNLAYNFDSAAGIFYEVGVTRPYGERIVIKGMANGQAFEDDTWYMVVVNSYRGNGGGELFTKGAGIPHEELGKRLVESTEKDLRSCIIEYIKKKEVVDAQPLNQWNFVPKEWAIPACARDRQLLFGEPEKEI